MRVDSSTPDPRSLSGRLALSLATLALIVLIYDRSIPRHGPATTVSRDMAVEAAVRGSGGEPDLSRVPGLIEAIPERVFHASPYNDWPLFELHVHEGQRLKFHRVKDGWAGDCTGLFTQFETPAEIDTKNEEVAIAALEEQTAKMARDVLREELAKDLEAAAIREENARQQVDRLDRLRDRTATTQAEHDRARNTLALARTQREQLAGFLAKKVEIAGLKADLADHQARRANAELQLADFKRAMSWANVPVARGRFEEVVVTKVQAARGDTPGRGQEGRLGRGRRRPGPLRPLFHRRQPGRPAGGRRESGGASGGQEVYRGDPLDRGGLPTGPATSSPCS